MDVNTSFKPPPQIWIQHILENTHKRKNPLESFKNLPEDTLMVFESSPSLLLTLQVTVRFTLGIMVILWVALPLE